MGTVQMREDSETESGKRCDLRRQQKMGESFLDTAFRNVKVRRRYCGYNICVGQMVLFEDVADISENYVGL